MTIFKTMDDKISYFFQGTLRSNGNYYSNGFSHSNLNMSLPSGGINGCVVIRLAQLQFLESEISLRSSPYSFMYVSFKKNPLSVPTGP